MRARRRSRSARARRAARPLRPVAVVLAHGVGVGREVAAEPVGERRALLGHGAHDHGQLPRVGGEAAEVVDDLGAAVERLRIGRLAPRRALLEDRDRPPGADQGTGRLLGELEEGADGADHEEAVAEEAHQLPDAQLAGVDLSGAEPDQADQEDPGEQHADGLDRGLPDARGDAGPAGLLRLVGVVATERLLAADAAQDAQPGHDVGGHRGELGVAAALDLLTSVQGPQQWQRSPQEHRGRHEHQHTELPRHRQHDGCDGQVGDELRHGAGQDLGQRTELVGVARRHAEDLTRGRATRQDVAHLGDLAGDHLGRAVEADQPAAHDQGVEDDPEDASDHHHGEHHARPRQQVDLRAARGCPRRRPDRRCRDRTSAASATAGRPGSTRDDLPLLPQHPPQECRRRPGVGGRRGCVAGSGEERRDPGWEVLHVVKSVGARTRRARSH